MPFTTVTANKLITKLLRNTDFTHPTAVYVSLHTADPAQNGASEVSGGSYARKVCAFNVASNKVTANTSDIEFANMPATTVTHIGLWGASTGGDFWWGGSLTTSKTLTSGDTLKIPTGDLDVTLT